jgi:KipI family sensor histidine kinase inhibitor
MELVAQARFLPAGECALVVEFGATIDPLVNDRVLALDAALSARRLDGIVETVPTYRSLMIHFEPRLWSHEALVRALQGLEIAPTAARAPRHWVVPACYEPPCAEDLGDVAQALSLPPQRVAALHAGADYRVYMYGFAPGYVFLGGLPAELAISRRPSPRPPIPPGALLIAGGQALIASVSMPTGWYHIGRTPAKTFDSKRDPPVLLEAGDHIRFEPVDFASFERLARQAETGAPILRQLAADQEKET